MKFYLKSPIFFGAPNVLAAEYQLPNVPTAKWYMPKVLAAKCQPPKVPTAKWQLPKVLAAKCP